MPKFSKQCTITLCVTGLGLLAFSTTFAATPTPGDLDNPCSASYNQANIPNKLSDSLSDFTISNSSGGISGNTLTLIPTSSKATEPATAILNIPAKDLTSQYSVYTVQACVRLNSFNTSPAPQLNITSDGKGVLPISRSISIAYVNSAYAWTVYRTTFYKSNVSDPSDLQVSMVLPGDPNHLAYKPGFSANFKNFSINQGELPAVPVRPVPAGTNIVPPNQAFFAVAPTNGSVSAIAAQEALAPFWGVAETYYNNKTTNTKVADTLMWLADHIKTPAEAGNLQPPVTTYPKNWNVLAIPFETDAAENNSTVSPTYNSISLKPWLLTKDQLKYPNTPYVLSAWVYVPQPSKADAAAMKGSVLMVSINHHNDPTDIISGTPTNFTLGTDSYGKWVQIKLPFTVETATQAPQIQLQWYYKYNKPTSTPIYAYMTGIQLNQLTSKIVPPKNATPADTPVVSDFAAYKTGDSLSDANWLLPNRRIGSSDEAGVFSNNVDFTYVDGKPALQLRYFGGDDSSAAEKAAWSSSYFQGATNTFSHLERQGAAIVTRNHYATAVYTQCVRFPTDPIPGDNDAHNTGAVSAFWPFDWESLQPGQQGYNDQGNPIRNAETDIEIPGSNLAGNEPVSYREARLNSWGAQWGGDSGNMTSRPPYSGVGSLYQLNGNSPMDDGKFHQWTTIIYSGGKPNANGQRAPGFVAWFYNKNCDVQSNMYTVNGQKETLHQVQQDLKSNPGSTADRAALDSINPFIFSQSGATANPNYNGALGHMLQLKEMSNPEAGHDKTVACPAGSNPANGSCSEFIGSNYGRDNVPASAMRYWIGIWTPGGSQHVFKTTTNGVDHYWWGWGGTPDLFGEDQHDGTPDYLCDSKVAKAHTGGLSKSCASFTPEGSASYNMSKQRYDFLKKVAASGGIRAIPNNERNLDISSVVVLPFGTEWSKDNYPLRYLSMLDESTSSSHYLCVSPGVPANCVTRADAMPTGPQYHYTSNGYPILQAKPTPPTPKPGDEPVIKHVVDHMSCVSEGSDYYCTVSLRWQQADANKYDVINPVITDSEGNVIPVDSMPKTLSDTSNTDTGSFSFYTKSGETYRISLKTLDSSNNTENAGYNPSNYTQQNN